MRKANVDHTISGQQPAISTLDYSATIQSPQFFKIHSYQSDIHCLSLENSLLLTASHWYSLLLTASHWYGLLLTASHWYGFTAHSLSLV